MELALPLLHWKNADRKLAIMLCGTFSTYRCWYPARIVRWTHALRSVGFVGDESRWVKLTKVIEAGSLLMPPDSGTSFDGAPDAIVRRYNIGSLSGPLNEAYLYGRGGDGVFQDNRLAQTRRNGAGAIANRLMDS